MADERRAYGAARLRRVIAVSSGVGRELQEFYRVPASRITGIPNGVDHATFHPVNAAARAALRDRLGLPIIAHSINGTEDLITSSENGFLSAIGPEALRECVVRLRDDAMLRDRMRSAIALTSQRYSWDRILREHLNVLREVAQRTRGVAQ